MTTEHVRTFNFTETDETVSKVEDDTFTPKVAPGVTTGPDPLAALRETITAAVQKPDLSLQVITRPGMTIRFSTNMDLDTIQQWRRRCQDKSQPDNFNLLKFECMVIANQAQAFGLNGQEPMGEDGAPISFRSSEVLTWTGQKRALDAVKALYDNDAHVVLTAQEVMEEAGFGDEMMEADEEGPTRRS